MWWRSVFFTGLLFSTFIALTVHLAWLILAAFGKILRVRIPYVPFGWAALGMVAILCSCLAYGRYVGMWRTRVTDVEYQSEDVPDAFDGYRIVHISDLHVDTFDSKPQALQDVVDIINAQDADLILFTGDMVTGYLESVFGHKDVLSRMHAKDGVMSVLGNHDFFIYDPSCASEADRDEAAAELTRFEESLGWKVLRNASTDITRGEESIVVAGVDNTNGAQGFHTIQKGDLAKAVEGRRGRFTILLSHDPGHWTADVLPHSDIQVTLSGHTHAAQVRLLGISLARLMFKECDGRYDHEGRMLYVNAGIGCTAPFRIGCPSEITVITLKSKS